MEFDQNAISRMQAEEAQKVREEAFEAQQQYQLDEANRMSLADKLAEGWDEMDIGRPGLKPMATGWNVFSTPIEPGTGRKRKRMR